MGKKMRMPRLAACALAAALALGGAAMTLATPTVAEAYPSTATKPKHLKSELSYNESDVIQLSGGKDYWFAGTVDIDHYEVEGGTKENPTRLYFTNSSSLGGPLTVNRDLAYSQHPLFVLKGGYVEFIGDSGTSTEVRCNGKTFLSDSNDYRAHGSTDKPNTGKSLDLTVKDLKLVSKIDSRYTSDRAITLYGTMGKGETASFTNVDVSGWKCRENSAFAYCNIASTYEASPAPVTIRGSHVAVDATFNNCTFKNNTDDCVGALSVVGRAKVPKVTLNGCAFENNSQGMIACDELKVESGHVHAGNIAVKNAKLVLNNCSIRSTNDQSWNGPCSYMFTVCDVQHWMHMTSAIAVAEDASCTINDTVIDDLYAFPSKYYNGRDISGQDEKRCAVYALGSVTLAGKTKVATNKAKGVDASDVGSYGKIHVDASFTGEATLSVDDSKFDPESNKQYYYYEYVNLGTSDLSQEDLASRLKLANADAAYEVTDGKVKVIHRKHEHEWSYSINEDGYSIAATCEGQYEASHCVYSRDGETISLMSSKSGDLNFTYNGKQRDAVLDTTKPSQKDNAVAQGKVKITGARFYRCLDENDTVGIEMEGSQPCDAGFYRVVATVAIEGQDDVTLERVFKIAPASLVEKDANRKDLCKIEIVGYDKLKDNVRFNNGDVRNDIPSYKWTGKEITPRIKVTYKLDGEWVELKEGVDFERFPWGESVSEKDPGAYRSQVWGLGNFTYGPFFYWSIYGTQFENVKATGYAGPYDGQPHTASVTVDNAPEGMKIEYSEDDGETWSETAPFYIDATRDDEGNLCAKTVKYRVTADDYVPVEGEIGIQIDPVAQEKPTGVAATDASGHGLADGSIAGVTDACEWKAVGSEDGYQSVAEGETSVTGLCAGDYLVRFKGDKNHYDSESVRVTVADGPKRADGSGWKFDDAGHWNMCTCGEEKLDATEHSFVWVIDKAPTATEAGSKHQECTVCGYKRAEEEIPAYGIKGYSGVYDGAAHGVTVDSLAEGFSASFSTDGVNYSPTAPTFTNVCDVMVFYRIEEPDATDPVAAGTVKVRIDPRELTVKAEDASKVYGEADPVLGYKLTKGSLVEGESLAGVEVVRDMGENVREGGYAMQAMQDLGANPNYRITFENGTFTITQREIGIAWSGTEFVYDGEDKCPDATATGAINNDAISLTVEGAAKKAGAHTATVTGLTGDKAGNYKLPESGYTCEFTIKKAPQGAPVVQAEAETISGKSDGKITGVNPAMEWRAGDEGDYQAVSEGVGELKDLAPGAYSVRFRADDNRDASAATKVTVAEGRKLKVTLPAEQEGYTLKADTVDLSWKGTAKLTFKLAEGYHKTDAFAVKVNGAAVALDDNGCASVTAEDDLRVTVEGVEAHKAAGDWVTDDGAHWHVCACGEVLGKANHTFEWVIDKAPTATEAGSRHQECTVCGYKLAAVEIPAASIAGYSGEYDGAYHTVDASALPGGAVAEYSTDGGKTWSSEAPKIKDAGTLEVAYKVVIDGTTIKGEVVLEVTPCKLTVAAKNTQKVYGEADPVLGYEVTAGSLVEGESLDGISVKRDEGVRAGGYVINVAQEKGVNANYDITFEPGVFTITQRALTVTWGATEFVYNGDAKAPAATLGGVLEGDKVTATVEGAAVNAGSYTATVKGLTGEDAGNYALPADGLTCAFVIKNAEQGTPAVEAVAETVSGRRDGKISGVDASMEWRVKGKGAYQAVPKGASALENLEPGTYQVRYKAKANHDASNAAEVTVAAGRKLVVTLPSGQTGYTLTAGATELDWHGTATLTFALVDGYFAGPDFAVRVNGEKVELTDGAYVLSGAESDVNVTVEGVLAHAADGAGWKSDVSGHWHDCVCGEERLDAASHTFDLVIDVAPTACAPGVGHEVCRVCGAVGKADVEIAMLDLKIVEGAGQKLVEGAGKDLTVRSNAPFDAFVGVRVDGARLDASSFDVREGSTVVTLHADYLATLAAGEHTLSVVSLRAGREAEAQTTFTIEKAEQPATPETPGAGGATSDAPSSGAVAAEKGNPSPAAKKPALPEAGDGAPVAAAAALALGSAVLLAAAAARRRDL